MSCQICEIWDEICSELFSIAPAYQSYLARPTTVRAILAVERNLGLKLPSDYAQFLQIHNGTLGNFFLAFEFFGILDVRIATHARRKEALEPPERQFIDGGWDHSKLMIGDNQCGWGMVLDSDSGAVFAYQQNNSAVQIAECFEQYLLGIRHNLKSKHYELVKGEVFMLEFGAKWGV